MAQKTEAKKEEKETYKEKEVYKEKECGLDYKLIDLGNVRKEYINQFNSQKIKVKKHIEDLLDKQGMQISTPINWNTVLRILEMLRTKEIVNVEWDIIPKI